MAKGKKRANKTRRSKKRGKLKAYYFRGRNTAVMARSAKQAKQRKQRPKSDKIVSVRNAQKGEGGSKWSTIRHDGKSKAKSKYGKGRGQGPPRKRSKK